MRVKIVRDRTPCSTGKQKPVNSVAGKHALLCAKLHEEAAEIALDATDPNEYADLIEVAMALAELNGVGWFQIEEARRKKFEERGGFKKGLVWSVDVPN